MILAALITVIVFCALVPVLACRVAYRRGYRDGDEDKHLITELPAVELDAPNLRPLDITETTDRLIYEARMEGLL